MLLFVIDYDVMVHFVCSDINIVLEKQMPSILVTHYYYYYYHYYVCICVCLIVTFEFLSAFVDRFYELKNIALNKPSFQSTKHHNNDPAKANTNDETCQTKSITHSHKNNYWMVDLERRAVVLNVTVIATKPDHEEHGTHFTIKVGDQEADYGDKNSHCVHNVQLPFNVMKNFTCTKENEGRYVTIHQHNGHHHRHLRLCYVKVFGIYL